MSVAPLGLCIIFNDNPQRSRVGLRCDAPLALEMLWKNRAAPLGLCIIF